MTRLRVEEVVDELIAADVARAGEADRKGKRPTRTTEQVVPGIPVEETAVGGGPRWPLIGGLVGIAIAILLGGGFALGLIGGGVPATPTPGIAETPTPGLVDTPTPRIVETPTPVTATATPTSPPVGLTYPPNTVFDGCIVIDPQGNTTVLAAAFTVFNVQAGEYRGAFAEGPTGVLSGTGTATGGQNPIVVPMRATRFGTYDGLMITAPDGMPVALGPIGQLLPLEINAQTNVRNDCDPAALQAPTQQALAARDYREAVAPVNDAAAEFATAMAEWTSATTSAQAVTDAAPFLAALQAVQPKLLALADAYPPAADSLRAANAAVTSLIADLSDLGRLETIGLAAWSERYAADLAALASASNEAREQLGIPAIGEP